MEKRIKINNPFDKDQNHCFGCGKANPIGLRLSFEESERYLHALWSPAKEYQGYINVVHGGIIASLLDEIGAWCINVKAGTSAVTSQLTVRYLKPLYISKGNVNLDAEIINCDKGNAKLLCRIFDGDGKQCAEADIDYFLYPEHIARKRYYYPGKEAFYYNDDKHGDQ